MSTQMIVRLDPQLKDKLNKLARSEGKTSSQVVRDLIGNYIKEKDIGSYIDNLWDRIGEKLKNKGVTPNSIGRTIKDIRKAQK